MEINHVLIVEDDKEIREGVQIYLQSQGYKVFQAADGIEGLEVLEKEEIHLAIIDIMMPRMDGIRMTMKLREKYDFPVIMLSAKSEEVDKITGLNIGADDYVTKPFDIKEVLARVAVQIRRMEGSFSEGNLVYQGLELDRENFCVRVDQTELPKITRQEFSILELLLKHPKKVFSKEEIFEYAWEEAYMGETKTLDVHISNIRKKIKSVTSKEYIETIWGIGYRLHP